MRNNSKKKDRHVFLKSNEDMKSSNRVIKGFSNIFQYINKYLFDGLNNSKNKLLLVYFISISILEFFSYLRHGISSVISSRVWLLGGLICFLTIVAYFIKSFVSDIREKKYLSIISILVLIFSLFILIGNINLSEINPDATQQAAAGMDSFSKSDLNYSGKAFLGYPNRQYIITAIPAFLFGRSIITLHLGFALPFILGILLLYAALRIWAENSGVNTALAVLPLYALFVFPFVTEYYTNFEQAIYPISFTIIAIGFFIIILCNPNVISIIGFAWIGCLLSNSYTPAMATLGLMIVFIALSSVLWLKKPDLMPFSIQQPILAAKAFLLVEGNIIAFFIATIIDKRQDRLSEVRSDVNILAVSYKSIIDFLIDKNARFMGFLGAVVIIYIFASLSYQLKKRDVMISLWILGVFAASNLLTGYTSYQPSWIMQRALVIIPVLLVGITITFIDKIQKYKIEMKNSVITILLISFAFIGIYNINQTNQSFTYFNYIQPMKYMFHDLEETIHKDKVNQMSDFNLIVYTDNALMKNPADYCEFFYPNAKVYTPEQGLFPKDINLKLNTFVYSENEFYKEYPIVEKEHLTFENKKHNIKVNWYKGSITY